MFHFVQQILFMRGVVKWVVVVTAGGSVNGATPFILKRFCDIPVLGAGDGKKASSIGIRSASVKAKEAGSATVGSA